MRIGTLLVLVAVGLGAACKKSSPEFHQAQLQYDRLTSNEGDDAYLMPEMEQVSALLSQVPPNAVEVDRARALQAKIAAETARVRAERDAEQQARVEVPVAVPLPSTGFAPPPPTNPEVAPTGADAGEVFPFAGMTLAEFRRAFGDCVQGERPFDRGGQLVPSFPVIETPACLKRLRVPPESSMLFVDGKLLGSATLSAAGRAERARLDAGPPPPAPPQPEFILVPGGPTPPGYQGVPGTGVLPGAAPPPPPTDGLPSGAPSGTIQPRTN